MTMKEQTTIIPLIAGHEAQIVVTRVGQARIDLSDEVCVRLELRLPASSDGDLIPEIQFSHRVWVLNEPLGDDWGEGGADGTYRFITYKISRKTWAAAFAEAVEKGTKELQKLIDALTARAQALADAEKE